MTSVTKIEQIYKSGNEELAIQLLNSLSDYSCIKYLLIHLGRNNLMLMLNSEIYSYTLIEHTRNLFAYLNFK